MPPEPCEPRTRGGGSLPSIEVYAIRFPWLDRTGGWKADTGAVGRRGIGCRTSGRVSSVAYYISVVKIRRLEKAPDRTMRRRYSSITHMSVLELGWGRILESPKTYLDPAVTT
jgi:hypothetical protein